jgi:hypothetical protein
VVAIILKRYATSIAFMIWLPKNEPERVGPCSNLEKVNQILYQANPKMGAIVGVHLSN